MEVVPLERKPDPMVITELEKLLEYAHAGWLTGYVCIFQTNKDGMHYSTAGEYDLFSLVGTWEAYKARLLSLRTGTR